MKRLLNFKKFISLIMVVIIVPLWSQSSRGDDDDPSSFKEFVEKPELREIAYAALELGAIYKIGGNIVPIATTAFPILGKVSPILSDASAALAPITVLSGGILENDKRLESYFNMMWATFLNDPKILGPSPKHPQISYARDVFNEATEMVNKVLQEQGINYQVNPANVFVSENWDASKYLDKSTYFIPVTEFAFGDVVERVALDIATQVVFFCWPKKLSEYASTHRQDGSPRPWYSYLDGDNGISPLVASKIYAAKILNLPAPETSLETSDKIFYQAYQKYLEGFYERSAENEKNYLNIRLQKYPTTLKGPQTGAGTFTHCYFDGQESLFSPTQPLSTCRTLRIKDLSVDPKVQDIYNKVWKTSSFRKAKREFKVGFWPAQADVLMILLTDGLVGARLSKYMEGANLIQKGAIKGVRYLALPAGAIYASSKTISVVTKGTKYDLNAKVEDTDILVSLAMMMTLSRELNMDPDDPNNEKHQKILEEQFQKLLLRTDPEIVSILNQLTHP